MTADVTLAGDTRLTAHPLRAAVLGEVHARPFTPIETPRRVLHFAFETTAERGEADRAALTEFCATRGLATPLASSKHHRVLLGPYTRPEERDAAIQQLGKLGIKPLKLTGKKNAG